MAYQRIQLSTQAKVGDPAPLPDELVGFSDETLANLPAAIDPCPDAYADTGFTFVADPPANLATNTVIDVPTFFMRFTAAERIAIRKSTDPVVEDFMTLLNDPRTSKVNLALPTVQGAVAYLAGQVGEPPLAEPLIAADRVATILAATVAGVS